MLKITVLVDNTVIKPMGLKGEHGLSMLIEKDGKKVLFDTGQSDILLKNLMKLDIDVDFDAVVVSHGHYDHAGGLKAVLENTSTKVFIHREAFKTRYAEEPFKGFIGIPFKKEVIEDLGDVIYIDRAREIIKDVWVSGYVERITPFEKGDSRLYFIENGKKVADIVEDDMSLYIKTKKGLIIVLGCAHAGLVNIIEHARRTTGVEKICGIIGGTHLGLVGKEQRRKTIKFLKSLDFEFIAPNHCTTQSVIAELKGIFGDRLLFAGVGFEHEFS